MAPDQRWGGTKMVRTMTTTKHRLTVGTHQQRGFALLETLIAIVVLMIGLLAVLASFALAVGNTASVQNDSIARQKAAEALESIFTARQTNEITFDNIQNHETSNVIFEIGFNHIT